MLVVKYYSLQDLLVYLFRFCSCSTVWDNVFQCIAMLLRNCFYLFYFFLKRELFKTIKNDGTLVKPLFVEWPWHCVSNMFKESFNFWIDFFIIEFSFGTSFAPCIYYGGYFGQFPVKRIFIRYGLRFLTAWM